MLTPLALALHEVSQLLSTARGRLARANTRGKMQAKLAGRVEAFEESEDILVTAVTVQQEADAQPVVRSYRGYLAGFFHKSGHEPPERVVVPYEGEGGLRSLLEDRDDDSGAASTPRPSS